MTKPAQPDPHQFRQAILAWYPKHGRSNLPWQQAKTPYKVWLSEIMLQQTQVSTVIPYFERFFRRYKTVTALANADLDTVLSLWSGLGYYARARNLHKTAQIVVEQHNGHFPADLAALMALPGIGRSTAGAILSLGFDEPAPILDGNVKRVLARSHKIGTDIKSPQTINQLWQLATQLTPNKGVSAYTQAMMDIGATLCTRTQPNCQQCPIQSLCLSHHDQTQLQYPARQARKAKPHKRTNFALLLNEANQVLLYKRDYAGIWGGLWCFPTTAASDLNRWCQQELGIEVIATKPWPDIKHVFSHFTLTIQPILVSKFKEHKAIAPGDDYVWHDFPAVHKLAVSAPVATLLQSLSEYQVIDDSIKF